MSSASQNCRIALVITIAHNDNLVFLYREVSQLVNYIMNSNRVKLVKL